MIRDFRGIHETESSCVGVAGLAALAVLLVVVPIAAGDSPLLELVPNTAVLLAKVSSGGGGNGGNTSSTSNATNIFAPASYVDYHQIGGEPTTVVDHYPFNGSFSCQAAPGATDTLSACQG